MPKYIVGDWWRTRAGKYVQISYLLPSKKQKYPVYASNGTSYTLEGSCWDGETRDLDLVQKMKTPVWEEDTSYPHQIAEHWEHEDGEVYIILSLIGDDSAHVESVDDSGARRGVNTRTKIHLSKLKQRVKFAVVCETVMQYVED